MFDGEHPTLVKSHKFHVKMQPFHNFWWFKLYVSTIMVSTSGILWCGLAITQSWHRMHQRAVRPGSQAAGCRNQRLLMLTFAVPMDCIFLDRFHYRLHGLVPHHHNPRRPFQPILFRLNGQTVVLCRGQTLDLLFLIVIHWAHLYKAVYVSCLCFEEKCFLRVIASLTYSLTF